MPSQRRWQLSVPEQLNWVDVEFGLGLDSRDRVMAQKRWESKKPCHPRNLMNSGENFQRSQARCRSQNKKKSHVICPGDVCLKISQNAKEDSLPQSEA